LAKLLYILDVVCLVVLTKVQARMKMFKIVKFKKYIYTIHYNTQLAFAAWANVDTD